MALTKVLARQCGAESIPSLSPSLSPLRKESVSEDLHFRLAGFHYTSFYSAKPPDADLSFFRELCLRNASNNPLKFPARYHELNSTMWGRL